MKKTKNKRKVKNPANLLDINMMKLGYLPYPENTKYIETRDTPYYEVITTKNHDKIHFMRFKYFPEVIKYIQRLKKDSLIGYIAIQIYRWDNLNNGVLLKTYPKTK